MTKLKIFSHRLMLLLGTNSAVSVATHYWLDDQGIESRWGARFFANRLDRPWGPPSLLYKDTGSFPGAKLPGRGVDHPPHLAPRLKKE